VEYLGFVVLVALVVGGYYLLSQPPRDSRRHDEDALVIGPSLLTRLRVARKRARRNLLGLRQKAR
jgi:hypothetical protein